MHTAWVEVKFQYFSTSDQHEDSCKIHVQGTLTPTREITLYKHWTGGWLCTRAVLHLLEKTHASAPASICTTDCPACRPTLASIPNRLSGFLGEMNTTFCPESMKVSFENTCSSEGRQIYNIKTGLVTHTWLLIPSRYWLKHRKLQRVDLLPSCKDKQNVWNPHSS